VAERGAARPTNSATRLVKNQESRICETLQQVQSRPTNSLCHNRIVIIASSHSFCLICSFRHNRSVTIVPSYLFRSIRSVPFVCHILSVALSPSHSFVTFPPSHFLRHTPSVAFPSSHSLRPIRSSYSFRQIRTVTFVPSHSVRRIFSVPFARYIRESGTRVWHVSVVRECGT
jgi:hypothetical protein